MDLKDFVIETTGSATDDLISDLSNIYSSVEADITAELERVYGRVLGGVAPADMYGVMLQQGRLESLLTQIQGIYKGASIDAMDALNNITEFNVYNTYYKQQFVLSNVPGIDVSFTRIDPNLVTLITQGTTESWQKISGKLGADVANKYNPVAGNLSYLMDGNNDEILTDLNQKITAAFISGKSIDQMSDVIVGIMDNADYMATRIARTEATRCANAGFHAASEDAADQLGDQVELTKMWSMANVAVQHHTHVELDGQEKPLDEPFEMDDGQTAMYPGDFEDAGQNINCMCTTITLVNGDKPEVKADYDKDTGETGLMTPDGFRSWNSFIDDNNITELQGDE